MIGMFALGLGAAIASPLDDGEAAYGRKDYSAALEILRPLAERGDAKGQKRLGYMYQKGLGVAQDYEEAVKWYRLAADQGDAEGQVLLGTMYGYGYGVAKDDTESVKWFRLAAMQGSEGSKVFAHYLLGSAYRLGRGIDKDEVLAYMWFTLWFAESLERSDHTAQDAALKELKAIAVGMTRVQIAQAQEMATKCKAANYKNCD